jgi:nitroreductase
MIGLLADLENTVSDRGISTMTTASTRHTASPNDRAPGAAADTVDERGDSPELEVSPPRVIDLDAPAPTTEPDAATHRVIDLDAPRPETLQRAPVAPPAPRRSTETDAPRVKRLRPHVLFVCSNGGHLAQLMTLESWWIGRERSWVCFDKTDAESQLADEQVTWAHHPTTRNIPNLIRNFFLAVRMLRRNRPDVVVSTGAAVAVPFFAVARMLGIPTVFIEVYDRIDSPTLTGRLIRPFSSRFLVQWEEQLAFYRGAELVGQMW